MRLLKLLILVASICATAAPSFAKGSAARTDVIVLKVGTEARVGRTELRIKFLSVGEDSRCPRNVQCIQAGNASVRLRARTSVGPRAEFELNTNNPPHDFEFGRYTIALTDLRPYPTANGSPSHRRYRAELTITRR